MPERRKNHVDPSGLLEGRGVRLGDGECLKLRSQAANVLTEMDGEGSVDLRLWEEQRNKQAAIMDSRNGVTGQGSLTGGRCALLT